MSDKWFQYGKSKYAHNGMTKDEMDNVVLDDVKSYEPHVKPIRFNRGDIIYTELHGNGSSQHGERHCIVVQNIIGNKYAPTLIVIALTTSETKNNIPTHVQFSRSNGMNNIALCEQIHTIDKLEVWDKCENVGKDIMKQIDNALKISLGVN